jgi:hypothetical protein
VSFATSLSQDLQPWDCVLSPALVRIPWDLLQQAATSGSDT